jgi:hypothetical protein
MIIIYYNSYIIVYPYKKYKAILFYMFLMIIMDFDFLYVPFYFYILWLSYIEHIKNQNWIALTSSPWRSAAPGCSRCPDAIRFHSEANLWSAWLSKPRVVEAIAMEVVVTIIPIGRFMIYESVSDYRYITNYSYIYICELWYIMFMIYDTIWYYSYCLWYL